MVVVVVMMMMMMISSADKLSPAVRSISIESRDERVGDGEEIKEVHSQEWQEDAGQLMSDVVTESSQALYFGVGDGSCGCCCCCRRLGGYS